MLVKEAPGNIKNEILATKLADVKHEIIPMGKFGGSRW